MDRLSDFKPLERVSLPDLGDLRCSGLTLIVGPNSSGKSQLIQDLYFRVCGEPRTLVVANDVSVAKPDYEPFMSYLEAEGYFTTVIDENGKSHLRPLTTYVGLGNAAGQIESHQAKSWYSAYEEPQPRRRSEFLNYFGRLLVTALFLDRRLTSLNQVGLIDFETQSPQQDLHALYLDDTAKAALFRELLDSFGKAVWPDASRGSSLCLRVSDEGILPTAEDRLSPKKMAEYRTIETEGDGLKSYVATCVALLLGRRPVCLIDEPEMCLHPPQAYNLGRFIGMNGSSPESATFVATHSSQVLRGVIQTAKDVQIVRMTRNGKDFSAHLVPAAVLAEAVAKPTLRAESVLDGIFAQSVVILEGDGDRLVYQTAWETLADQLDLNTHFAAVGGTGGIIDSCKLYRALNIPVAVVADLDMIADLDKMKRLVEVLGSHDVVKAFVDKTRHVLAKIKELPPTVDPAAVTRELQEMIQEEWDWTAEDDTRIRQRLTRLAKQLDRMRKLKRGGINAFPDGIRIPLNELVTDLRGLGIFLVPVGELEEWLATENLAESKSNKWAWANAAALRIQSKGACEGDIWDFVRSIGAHLQAPREL